MPENDQHIYHHTISDGPKVNVKLEKNSRGMNYEVSISGASSVDEALALIKDAEGKLAKEYGEKPAA